MAAFTLVIWNPYAVFLHPWFPGNDQVTALEVFWPDGRFYTRSLQAGEMNSVVEVAYPKEGVVAALSNDTQVGP